MTPGDFAVVARRIEALRLRLEPDEIVDLLAGEVGQKRKLCGIAGFR